MAQMVAQMAVYAYGNNDIFNYKNNKRILDYLNYNRHSEHVVLYPVDENFHYKKQVQHAMETLTAMDLPNVHTQPFYNLNGETTGDNFVHLITNSTCYGRMGYCITEKTDLEKQTVKLTMNLFLSYS